MCFLKLNLNIVLLLTLITTVASSSKNSSTPPSEQSIAFTHNAGNNILNPGASLSFIITLTSTIPSSGIKVEISTREEANGNTVGSNSSVNSTASTVNVGISGLPRQVWCIVTIKVSSVTTPSNNATQTFRILYK